MDNRIDPRLKKIQEFWTKRPELTQRAAAKKLGISQSAVCQYMTGKIPLNTDIIINFAGLFEVVPSQIDIKLNFN